MALIFLGVPIIFNVSSFKCHQVKSQRLCCQWWMVSKFFRPRSSGLSVLGEMLES